MLQQWLSVTEGGVVFLLALLLFRYGGASLRWYRLTPALRRKLGKLPKGSLGWPVVGETLALQRSLMSASPHTFVTDRRTRYGSDMFLTHLFGTPLLASTDPDTNKLILTKEDLFTPTLPNSIKMAVGENAILLQHGERHKRFRRLSISVCSPDTLKYHAPYIQEFAASTLQSWKGRKVIVADEAQLFTFSVVQRVLLGVPRGQRSERFFSKFMDLRRGVRSLPVDLPGTSYRKAVLARKALERIVQELIVERKESKEAHFPDLLGKLISANESDGGDNLTHTEIIDVILSTMLAGFDTSSSTLLFLVYYIGQHPGLHHDLKVEHEEILKQKEPNVHLTWNDYKKMKLTQFAINETLRLANPALSLHRKVVKDFEYNGSIVPAGSQVQVWLRTIHTDPKIYPQPYDFDVSRWKVRRYEPLVQLMKKTRLPGDPVVDGYTVAHFTSLACSLSKAKATTNNFYPFGVGPRQCVGMELARLELCFFIHVLVTTYSWEMTENDRPKFFPEPGMRKGLPIVVTEV